MAFTIWRHCFGLVLVGASSTDSAAWPDEVNEVTLLQVRTAVPAENSEEGYWTRRGRGLATSSFAPFKAPSNFSAGPAWTWKNELNEQVRHSPLIDADRNIYVSTSTRLRKFDSDGKLLWHLNFFPTHVSTAPALYKGNIIVLCNHELHTPLLASLNATTGKGNWERHYSIKHYLRHGDDAQAILVHNDTIIFGTRSEYNASKKLSNGTVLYGTGKPGDYPTSIEKLNGTERIDGPTTGTDMVVAVNASTGEELWKYKTGEVMWNFSPSTSGDGTLLFSGSCGAVFRLSWDGKLIWKKGPSHVGKVCVPAGGALGPNGIFYSVYNEDEGDKIAAGVNNTVAAYNVNDGSLVWKVSLPYRAAQYPAVGKLGHDGPLAVVVAVGDSPQPPMPKDLESAQLAKRGGVLRNMVTALNANTGAELWEATEKPFTHMVAAGELELHNASDGSACKPDAQGIPLISGDGTVYTSSSHNGDLSAINDLNNDGVISASEVSIFKTGRCFLNSPSIAPGMLVAAPCWGPMYVFKS